MISWKHRFVFVHIPKCAGTSIEAAFLSMEDEVRPAEMALPGVGDGRQHWSLSKIQYEFPETRNFTVISVVRNPWERIVSELAFFKIPIVKSEIIKFLKRDYHKNHPLYPQKDFLTNLRGDLQVDHLIRFENLEAGFEEACRNIGFSGLRLPDLNKTRHEKFQSYYDAETRDAVLAKYQKDVEWLGYEFGT